MGRGGVRPASKSSIEIDFYYRGVRCRERVRLPPTPRNLRYAENLKGEIENAIARGTFNYADHFPDSPRAKQLSKMPGDTTSLADYLERWLQREKQNTKASTWEGYRKIIQGRLIPAFGELTLTGLRRKHVLDWLDKQTASKKTLGNILSPLRIALDDAVDAELIEHNPLAGWKLRRRNDKRRRHDSVDPFTSEEREAILSTLNGQGRNLIQFAFWTGLRTSELCALEWSDIDFVRGFVRINKALTQHSDEPEDTKTDAGEREVKLLSPALEALKAQKAHTYLAGVEVFQNPRTGERWTGDQPIRKTLWQPALKRAGVRYRRPYQTRHTYASMMLMAGEHVMWVSRQMGHADWAFTARTYARFIPDDMPDAGSKAEIEWSASGQPPAAKPHG